MWYQNSIQRPLVAENISEVNQALSPSEDEDVDEDSMKTYDPKCEEKFKNRLI